MKRPKKKEKGVGTETIKLVSFFFLKKGKSDPFLFYVSVLEEIKSYFIPNKIATPHV